MCAIIKKLEKNTCHCSNNDSDDSYSASNVNKYFSDTGSMYETESVVQQPQRRLMVATLNTSHIVDTNFAATNSNTEP